MAAAAGAPVVVAAAGAATAGPDRSIAAAVSGHSRSGPLIDRPAAAASSSEPVQERHRMPAHWTASSSGSGEWERQQLPVTAAAAVVAAAVSASAVPADRWQPATGMMQPVVRSLTAVVGERKRKSLTCCTTHVHGDNLRPE